MTTAHRTMMTKISSMDTIPAITPPINALLTVRFSPTVRVRMCLAKHMHNQCKLSMRVFFAGRMQKLKQAIIQIS